MRLAIFACLFALCLIREALAADPVYVQRWLSTDRDPTNPNSQTPINIKYLIKRPDILKAGSPVFYGVGGRVSAEALRDQYTFFDKQLKDLNDTSSGAITPIIVYVEQRYVGNPSNDKQITALGDLAFLTLDNVIKDHVILIKSLSNELNTKNFLVFGGGHGGVIAGYLANKFATDTTDTTLSSYNVLAWSSSPPIKYLRRATTPLTGTDFQGINTKLNDLLINTGGCVAGDITKLNTMFNQIKGFRKTTTGTDNVAAASLKLLPKLNVPGNGVAANLPSVEQREFVVYFRKQLINLAFNNNPFDLTTNNPLGANRNLRKFCTEINSYDGADIDTAAKATFINNILAIFTGNNDDVQWKLKTQDGVGNDVWNQKLVASYYQDCTEYQLIHCSAAVGTSDPLRGSYWNADVVCGDLATYNQIIKDECQGMFGNTLDTDAKSLDGNKYPASLNNRVITTVNKQSIVDGSYAKFGRPDYDYSKYSTYWNLNGVDNWEFQAPRDCDSAYAKDIRYLVLRAFGCLTGLIKNVNNVCDTTTLFNDNAATGAYDDTDPATKTTCPASTDANSKFPFGHAAVTFVDQTLTTTTQKITSPSTPSTRKQTSPSTKTTAPPSTKAKKTTTVAPPVPRRMSSTPSTTTAGSSSVAPMVCILFSSLFVWFTAGALM